MEGSTGNAGGSASEGQVAQGAQNAQQTGENTGEMRRIRKSIMNKYPDFKADTEEAWTAKEDEFFGEMEDELGTYRSSEEQLSEMIKANPDLAEVINDMVSRKMPFRVAVARHYSQEDLTPKEGEDDYEAYAKEYNDRLERTKKREARMKEIADNEAASLNAIDKFISDNSLTEEDKKGLVEYINGFFDQMLNKRISPEMLAMFRKAITHDSDVDGARKEGEIAGRNANIKAQMEAEDARTAGDGLPSPSKGADTAGAPKRKAPGSELFDIKKRDW